MSKVEYIQEVSVLLYSLAQVITKQQLVNYYLHELKIRGIVEANITSANLVEAATLAGKQVKGKSKLEVNVPIQEQWKFIRNGYGQVLSKERFKEKMLANKVEIVKIYEDGGSVKDIAKAYGCGVSTINVYLRKFGAKMRKTGRRKLT